MNIEIQRKKRQNYEKHDGKGTALRMVNSYPRSLGQSGLWEKRGKQKTFHPGSPVACVDAESISVGFFVGARKVFLLSLRVSRRKPLGNACYAGYRRGCNIPAFLPLGPLFIFYF